MSQYVADNLGLIISGGLFWSIFVWVFIVWSAKTMSDAERKYLKGLLAYIRQQDREAWYNFCVAGVVLVCGAWWML